MAGLGLVVDAGSDPERIRLGVEVSDPRYLGESAILEIYRLAEVHDAAAVNEIRLLSSQQLVLGRERIDVELPAGPIRGLTYRGKQVSVKTFTELRLYDGVLWDTTVRTEVGLLDLEDVTVRVIACNLEKGAYTRGSGSNKRVVNFSEPIRAVVLFEQRLPRVRRGQPLEASLEGPVRFAPLFDLLHPPCEVSPTHGLALQWEVQLLHDRFVDHELVAGPCAYRAADFACPTPTEPEPERAGSA